MAVNMKLVSAMTEGKWLSLPNSRHLHWRQFPGGARHLRLALPKVHSCTSNLKYPPMQTMMLSPITQHTLQVRVRKSPPEYNIEITQNRRDELLDRYQE